MCDRLGKGILRIAVPVVVMLSAGACITDSPGLRSAGASGNVTFRISVPSNPSRAGAPFTRALAAEDEWAVDPHDIAVLLFAAVDKTLVGTYRGEVVEGPTGGGGSSATIDFSVTLPLGGDYNLMVVANAGTILAECAAALGKGASQVSVEAALVAEMRGPAGWSTDPSDDASRIPLWGYAANVRSGDFTDPDGTGRRFSRTIGLVRMLARVDVALSQELVAKNTFVLRSVRVYNFNRTGRLIPATDPASNGGFDWQRVDASNLHNNHTPHIPPVAASDFATEWIDRTLAPGQTSLDGEIYLFEAARGTPPSPSNDDHSGNPCLVIGGSFEGGPVTYYRIDFANHSGDVWEYMPLLRNNRYFVTITDIASPGVGSPDEALRSVPVNIDAGVVDWVGGEGITTLVSNGVYMLGLSRDAFMFSCEAQPATSSAGVLTVVTDHFAGWSARVVDNSDGTTTQGSDWLTISVVSHPAADYPAGTTTQLLATAMPPDGADSRTAWVYVTAGNLTLKVRVTQTRNEPYISITRTDTGEELTALDFSPNDPAPQSFTVRWSPREMPIDMFRVLSGTHHFTWQDTATNSLTQLPAGGEFTFVVDPPTRQLIFRSLGSYLVFVLPDTFGGVISGSINLTQRPDFEGPLSFGLDPIASPPALPSTGGVGGVTVRSFVTGTFGSGDVDEAVPWVSQFSQDGGATWSGTPPGWIFDFPASGAGDLDGETIDFTVTPAVAGEGAMSSLTPRGTASVPWNLANETGADVDRNTANCYIVSAPGHYSLPLVYGNAVRDGAEVANTNTSTLSGYNASNILQNFLRHDGLAIDASYIYDNTGFGSDHTADDATLVWMDAAGLVSNVTLDDAHRHLMFEVPAATIVPGNAVVALLDSSGSIMWSWHIWVTDTDPTETVDVANHDGITYSFMRENLGSVCDRASHIATRRVEVRIVQQLPDGQSGQCRQFAISSDGRDPRSNNTFYQYGRKDPMPGMRDGYTLWFGRPEYNTNSGHLGAATSHGTIPLSIRNPHIFYIGTATSQYDWNYNTLTSEGPGYGYKQSVDNLWNIDNNLRSPDNSPVDKTVYDPSPVGFRLPPAGAFTGFTTTGTQARTPEELNVVDNSSEAFNRYDGWLFRTPASDVPVFFPATGYLRYDNGVLAGTAAGYYWSAGPINNGYSYYLQFNATEVNPLGSGGRSMAVSIRPVRE
jgi:hypothetical protein